MVIALLRSTPYPLPFSFVCTSDALLILFYRIHVHHHVNEEHFARKKNVPVYLIILGCPMEEFIKTKVEVCFFLFCFRVDPSIEEKSRKRRILNNVQHLNNRGRPKLKIECFCILLHHKLTFILNLFVYSGTS